MIHVTTTSFPLVDERKLASESCQTLIKRSFFPLFTPYTFPRHTLSREQVRTLKQHRISAPNTTVGMRHTRPARSRTPATCRLTFSSSAHEPEERTTGQASSRRTATQLTDSSSGRDHAAASSRVRPSLEVRTTTQCSPRVGRLTNTKQTRGQPPPDISRRNRTPTQKQRRLTFSQCLGGSPVSREPKPRSRSKTSGTGAW